MLLYTTGGRPSLFLKWRNVEGMLPMRLRRTISLAKSPGSLVRFTFHGAHGETCTRTVPLLRRMSLLLDYAGLVLPVGLAPTLSGV